MAMDSRSVRFEDEWHGPLFLFSLLSGADPRSTAWMPVSPLDLFVILLSAALILDQQHGHGCPIRTLHCSYH
jgi:hypothetical protein